MPHVSVAAVADRLRRQSGLPLDTPDREVLLFATRAFCLTDKTFQSYDLPLAERLPGGEIEPRRLLTALKAMGLRTGMRRIREALDSSEQRALLAHCCADLQTLPSQADEEAIIRVMAFGATALFNSSPTTLWKSFAFLFPERIPVADSLVRGLYSNMPVARGNRTYTKLLALMNDYRSNEWQTVLGFIWANLPLSHQQRLSILRVFDICLWRSKKAQECPLL
ncbi:MAG: hypothetical protein FJ279_23755 [Planctomycetes bacterium]|nr:hypothetical protein [Planctomycetota bacterium]